LASYGQASFDIEKTTVCLQESLLLSNSSSNTENYEWDFCLGDFLTDPELNTSNVDGLSAGWGIEMVEDAGQYYAFVVDRGQNRILRLDYGANPLNENPVINDLGNPNFLLNDPEDISIINYNGNWYGVVGYLDNGWNLTRLDFGNSITNEPVGIDLGSFGFNGRIRNVSLVEDDGSLLLMFTHINSNEFVIVDYRDSFDNDVTEEDIYNSGRLDDLNFASGFDFKQLSDGQYVVHVVSVDDEDVIRLDYGSDLFSPPTVSATYTLSGLSNNYNFELIEEGGGFYGAI